VIDTVLPSTALAPIEAVTVVSALAMADSGHCLLVREGQMGKAFEILWGISVQDILDGGHERSPCMRELMR
jgi:hypothetical protein